VVALKVGDIGLLGTALFTRILNAQSLMPMLSSLMTTLE
jgi:hypothetical protein